MPIQLPSVEPKGNKTIPATVAVVVVVLALAIRSNPFSAIALMVILALGAGFWLSW